MKEVIFRDRQEFQDTDINNVQSFINTRVSQAIYDGLATGMHYTQSLVTQNGSLELKVAPGRLYVAGEQYEAEGETIFQVTPYVPTTTKKILAVVAWGQAIETDVQPRDKLIDLENGTTQASSVPMQKLNKMEINFKPGVESADPQLPEINSNTLLIATVVLSPTGIESITMNDGFVMPNASVNQHRLAILDSWKEQIEPKIGTISTDIAALNDRTELMADQETIVNLSLEMARLGEKVGLPSTYAEYSASYFGDMDDSDNAQLGYEAEIKNGMLFPIADEVNANLSLFNPNETKAKKYDDNLLLPEHDLVPRIRTVGHSGDISASTYQVTTQTVKKYTRTSRVRHYGYRYNYYRRWYNNHYYRYNPYYYKARWPYYYRRSYIATSVTRYAYYTSQTSTHYKLESSTSDYQGAIVAQTALVSNGFWLGKVALNFTSIAASGDVHVFVCETSETGKPLMEQTLSQVTIPQAQLKRYPAETAVEIPPVFLDAGKRVALVIMTTGAHKLAVVNGNNYTQGTLFYGNDGDYFEGDLTKDLMFTFYAMEFKQARTEVQLGAVTLAGGITDLEINTTETIPDGANLEFEIQVNGDWYSLADGQNHLSNGATSIVPVRAVFTGTSDVMPAFELKAGALYASKCKEGMMHFSKERTLSSPTNSVVVETVVHGYDAGKHAFETKIFDESGPSGVAADSTVETDLGDGARRFKCTFTLSAQTKYRIRTYGTRGTADEPFQVVECVDVAI